MIRSFKHRGLKRLYERGDRSGVRSDLAAKIERILSILDVAREQNGVDLPGYQLHALKGDRLGFWAVSVNANWRIVFRFDGVNVCDVELLDYH